MSGKPYPEGVQQLSAQFRLIEDARQKQATYKQVVELNQKALDEAVAAERAATEEIHRLMESMDVKSPGNTGYEQRMLWLLRELNDQAERYGRSHP